MIVTPYLVLFMVVVFILLFLFLNTVDKRKWLTFLISLILTPFAYFYLFYPFLNILSNYHHQKYFSSEAWQEKPALRYEMIDHTIESDTLIGLQKNTVKTILGDYEWLSWDETEKAHNPNKWNYGLGIEPGAFNEKREGIEITFKNDTVLSLTKFEEEVSYDEEE